MAKSASDCIDARQYLHGLMITIEDFKIKSVTAGPQTKFFDEKTNAVGNDAVNKLPVKEDTYLQQSKRSVYYTKCAKFLDQVKKRSLKAQ